MITPQTVSTLKDLLGAYSPGHSLEQAFYTDPGVFEADMKYIFMRHWLYAGHASQIPEAGDYITYEIGVESLIIIRGRDGRIRAFFNVCPHRGSRICLDSHGHAQSLVCPYHQWVFQADGKLVAAKNMGEDFDKSAWGLRPAHLREAEGFLFLSLAEDPPSFEPFEEAFRAHARPHQFVNAKICRTLKYDVRSNWKLLIENSRECDHCSVGHPEYTRIMFPQPAEHYNERLEYFKSLGLETRRFLFRPDTWHKVERYPLGKGMITQSLNGEPVAPLMGVLPKRDVGAFTFLIRHNLLGQFLSDYGSTTSFIPISPLLTRVQIDWFVRGDAVEGVDYDSDRVCALWRTTQEQDNELCEWNQAGVNSSRYRPGPYSAGEEQTEDFVRWYVRELGLTAKDDAPALRRDVPLPAGC